MLPQFGAASPGAATRGVGEPGAVLLVEAKRLRLGCPWETKGNC